MGYEARLDKCEEGRSLMAGRKPLLELRHDYSPGGTLACVGFMVVASLQLATVAARFLPLNVAANGLLLTAVILATAAAFFGVAILLQRILMPDRRSTFATFYFWTGILAFLTSSILSLGS